MIRSAVAVLAPRAARLNPKPCRRRFSEATDEAEQEKQKKPQHTTRETAAAADGGGYATRADEEGYGVVYGKNKCISNEDEDKIVHGNAP
ncbi:hypothetical protein M569_02582, partial [Genlisea aurea]